MSGRREDAAEGPAAAGERGVDVVLPVYGAAAELTRCLRSLREHTHFDRHRLVVVLDGPQERAVEEALAPLAGWGDCEVLLLRNAARRGFAASANHGLAAGVGRDAVLLNSDTEVTAGWLEKLLAAAASAAAAGARVGTVTPFSNHATICSLPRFLAENAVPAGHSVDSFAALVERVAERSYPRLPTAVGFCMLVRRELLATVGTLDAERFGLGYGEEVDLCLRASAAGFVHLLDDATYVWHRGQGSFGGTYAARVRRAERRLRRRYPSYLPAVADFIRRDPLAPLRERVLAALRRRVAADAPPRRVLHVVHGWPPFAHGGTELYAAWLAREQSLTREVTVLARLADPSRRRGDARELQDGAVRVRLLVNNFTQRDPLSRNALHDGRARRELARLVAEERSELVHVHHLGGHCATLLGALRGRVPLVYQVQDWWSPCARANLYHRDGVLCSGPAPRKCGVCLPLTARAPRRLWNPLLYRLRHALTRRALAAADLLLFGSSFALDSYRRLGWLPSGVPARVVPYGVALADQPPPPRAPRGRGEPVRFGFLGSLMPHKGVGVAVDAFAKVDPAAATLDLWGSAEGAPAFALALRERASAAVRFRGDFAEEEKGRVLAALDVLLVPSVGLESFGLVAREALHLGLPVIASRLGALGELDLDGGRGEPVDAGDVGELARAVERWTARVRSPRETVAATGSVLSMQAHAQQVDAVYREVLAARAGRPSRGRR